MIVIINPFHFRVRRRWRGKERSLHKKERYPLRSVTIVTFKVAIKCDFVIHAVYFPQNKQKVKDILVLGGGFCQYPNVLGSNPGPVSCLPKTCWLQ